MKARRKVERKQLAQVKSLANGLLTLLILH
nr:MAG TPA: hypothetical protein [Caudoviricetes sp.]